MDDFDDGFKKGFEYGSVAAFLIAAFLSWIVSIGNLPASLTPYVLIIAALRCWLVWRETDDEEN